MIKKKKKNLLLFLKKKVYKNNNIKKFIILKSIIQNNHINFILKYYSTIFINQYKFKNFKKKCLFNISNKSINKKSKFSRHIINKINTNNLIQNFKIND